jgi:hypothetical protein
MKDLIKKVADAAPLLGTALGGPLGGGIGSILAAAFGSEDKPDSILKAIEADPDAATKLQEIQSREKTTLAQIVAQQTALELAERTKQIQAVNATMQVEAKSEHWVQYSWRPFWGFVSALAFLALTLFVCFLTYKAIAEGETDAFVMIPQLIGSFTMLFGVPAAILGVASWHRGKEKRERLQWQK